MYNYYNIANTASYAVGEKEKLQARHPKERGKKACTERISYSLNILVVQFIKALTILDSSKDATTF